MIEKATRIDLTCDNDSAKILSKINAIARYKDGICIYVNEETGKIMRSMPYMNKYVVAALQAADISQDALDEIHKCKFKHRVKIVDKNGMKIIKGQCNDVNDICHIAGVPYDEFFEHVTGIYDDETNMYVEDCDEIEDYDIWREAIKPIAMKVAGRMPGWDTSTIILAIWAEMKKAYALSTPPKAMFSFIDSTLKMFRADIDKFYEK